MFATTFLPAPQTNVRHLIRCLRFVPVAVLIIGLGLLAPTNGHAQEPDSLETPEQTYRVETTEGTVLFGTLVSETDASVVLDTKQVGEVTIERTSVERMTNIGPDRFRNGEYWYPNPQSTRYFFAPNAIGIPKGQGYYQNTWILFNNVNYGVSDRFSIGAGTVPIFLFGASALPFWVLPKLSLSSPQDNLHLAGGAMLGGVAGGGRGVGAGLLYGSATVGDRDHNATFSLGYGYASDEISDTPAINVSGMTRLGRTTYLISENYFFPGTDGGGVVSFGVRWAPENFAVDFGLFRPLGDTDDFIALPWLGVTLPFGE